MKTTSNELETRIYDPAPVKGTRWIPHLDRALKVFIEGQSDAEDLVETAAQYSAIISHMDHLAACSNNADIAGRARKLSKDMKNLKFIAFSHFLADFFSEVSKLSLQLQTDDLILSSAISAVEDCLDALKLMKTKPLDGGLLEKFQTKCLGNNPVKFQGLALCSNDNNDVLDVLKRQFNDTISLTQDEIHKRFDNILGASKSHGVQAAGGAMKIQRDTWPRERQSLLWYSNEDVKVISEWFRDVMVRHGCEVDRIPGEWRSFKKTPLATALLTRATIYCANAKGTIQNYSSQRFAHCILAVLPISSANCERAFSAQKRIKSATRSCLTTSRLSDLILTSTEGPELAEFDPTSAVRRWREAGSGPRKPLAKNWNDNIFLT